MNFSHQMPIVPWVLLIGTRTRPYRIEPIERAAVLYATPSTIRVSSAQGQHSTKQDHYCLPTDQAWAEVKSLHQQMDSVMQNLATQLLTLGTYSHHLEQAGGVKQHPQLLSDTVIEATEPGRCWSAGWYYGPWHVPPVNRLPVQRHTRRMLQIGGSMTNQDGHFVCPTDSSWLQVQAAYQEASTCSTALKGYLQQLGTYSQALADGRYENSAEPQFNPAPQQQLSLLNLL